MPLHAEVLRREDMGDYVREKVIYDTEAFASVPAYVLVPKDLQKGEKRPGILAAHGHGIGKNPLVGLDADENPHEEYQKQLAIQFVKRGYVVVAPDVTYLITNFRKDFGMLKGQEKFSGSSSEGLRKAQLAMVRYTVESLRGIFKLHKVNLLDVFKVRQYFTCFVWLLNMYILSDITK